MKSFSTPQKKDPTKKFHSHIVYIYNPKVRGYSFLKNVSYYPFTAYKNFENYDLFNSVFSACSRSKRNPNRDRGCLQFYMKK